METINSQTLAAAVQTVVDSGNYKLLRRLDIDNHHGFPKGQPCSNLKIGICLDTETTGFKHNKDKIIELGMVSFLYNPDTLRVISILDRYNGFEDPGEPLSEDVINVTGITDDMLADQHLDDEKVMSMLSSANIIIAHNAGFDRPMMEARFPICSEKPWACSLSQINWSGEYLSSQTLEYLLYKCGGWFIDAHRALNDAEGLLALLMEATPHSGASIFQTMMERARSNDTRIYAVGSPFDKKDVLKERGYRWNDGSNGKPKSWWKDVDGNGTEELEWLSSIYPGGNTAAVTMASVNAYSRFSLR